MTDVAGGIVIYPIRSPTDSRMVYTVQQQGGLLLDIRKTAREQTPPPLPKMAEPNRWFWSRSRSPDGKRLAGWQQHSERAETALSGIVLYSFESQSYEQITDFGVEPVWLNDNRRLLFNHQGKLFLADSLSKQHREI